jgi:hypothetical protein
MTNGMAILQISLGFQGQEARDVHTNKGGLEMRKNMLAVAAIFAVSLCSAAAGTAIALEVTPSPPSIGADVPVTYFGPPPPHR